MVLMGLRRTSDGGVEMLVPGCEDLRLELLGLEKNAPVGDEGGDEGELWGFGPADEPGQRIESVVFGETPEGFREVTSLAGPIPGDVELEVLAGYRDREFFYLSFALFTVEELPEGDSVLVFQEEPLAEVSEDEFQRLAVEGDCVEWPQEGEPGELQASSTTVVGETTSSTSSATSTLPSPSTSATTLDPQVSELDALLRSSLVEVGLDPDAGRREVVDDPCAGADGSSKNVRFYLDEPSHDAGVGYLQALADYWSNSAVEIADPVQDDGSLVSLRADSGEFMLEGWWSPESHELVVGGSTPCVE